MKTQLKREIKKFKEWSENFASIPEINRVGEWELLYENWDKLNDLMCEFLKTINYRDWSEEELRTVLYFIARDNENEIFIDTIVESQPNALEFLAFNSFNFGEPNAKWQIAINLDKITDRKNAQLLLEKYLNDENEYVRRRALMTLAKFSHHNLERFCAEAWESQNEYQRIAVLHSLKISKSRELETYIQLAIEDGRKYLIMNAKKIKNEV